MSLPVNSPLKAPGRIRMKCMIWEPNPISERVAQDVTVVYNSTTIQSLPESIQSTIVSHNTAPYGIYLKEKYVYRDTFVKIDGVMPLKGEPMIAENGTALLDTNKNSRYHYVDHQTFRNVSPIYLPNFIEAAKWEIREKIRPFEHDGHSGEGGDLTNQHDYVSQIQRYTSDRDYSTRIDLWIAEYSEQRPTNDVKKRERSRIKESITKRKEYRYMPVITNTSKDACVTPVSSSGINIPTRKPIHWMLEKETPLFSGEDFFVEFEKLALEMDVVSQYGESPNEYIPLNSKYQSAANQDIRNGGVIEIGNNGAVTEATTETLNLMNQPYTLIEMGPTDPNHHYVILLAYNSFPTFIQIGKFNFLKPATETEAASIAIPIDNISRRLSSFKGVSCKSLLEQENLRVTVRNHLGKIIITFSGHEGNPWVISRTDFISTPLGVSISSSGTSGVTPIIDIKEKPVSMIVPNATIRIGGGNMKVGFLFAPLHYTNMVATDIPEAITVRGPVEEDDINLFLGERGRSDRNLYFQDAENYFEVVDGDVSGKIKTATDTIWPIKSSGKDCIGLDSDVRNQFGSQISYISITKTTPLLSAYPSGPTADTGSGEPEPETEPIPGAGYYIKWFKAKYTLRAGDGDVGTGSSRWRIWNSITPIGTGWRMYIPPNTRGHGMSPVDVAHHVRNFSHSWNYTDNAKLEHTGSIKFSINLGTPTSLANSEDGPIQTDYIPTIVTTPPDTSIDQSAFLAKLVDKTFFIRVYAWWEGGYMDCENGCPCRSPLPQNQPVDITGFYRDAIDRQMRCIFTGLCHGGEITIEGNVRYMDCQLNDYMKIVQDQYFLNSPFFDGMNDYFAVGLVCQMAGFTDTPQGSDNYAPTSLINSVAATSVAPPGEEWTMPYALTNETLYFQLYTLPSAYDILQNPFMKFADKTGYDEALSKISLLAGKVPYFDRFGVFRYDVRPDTRYLSATARISRRPKCNFMASPFALTNCSQLDLLALEAYTYKRVVSDVVNDILLVTANPEGEVLVKSVLNLAGRYDPTQAGYIGYTKRLLQMDGIFGSQKSLESIANYYSSMVFKPPTVVSWKGMGVPHLQAMDIVTFTGLNDDIGFPPHNVEEGSGLTPTRTVTLILTTVTGEINPDKQEWRNSYEGEWLYG